MNNIDLTYDGKLKIMVNVLEDTEMLVNYTVDSKTGKTTTTSFLINEEPMMMITFNYQDLKAIVEGENNESNRFIK